MSHRGDRGHRGHGAPAIVAGAWPGRAGSGSGPCHGRARRRGQRELVYRRTSSGCPRYAPRCRNRSASTSDGRHRGRSKGRSGTLRARLQRGQVFIPAEEGSLRRSGARVCFAHELTHAAQQIRTSCCRRSRSPDRCSRAGAGAERFVGDLVRQPTVICIPSVTKAATSPTCRHDAGPHHTGAARSLGQFGGLNLRTPPLRCWEPTRQHRRRQPPASTASAVVRRVRRSAHAASSTCWSGQLARWPTRSSAMLATRKNAHRQPQV